MSIWKVGRTGTVDYYLATEADAYIAQQDSTIVA